uniref:si:ch211-210c8.7 n=1 Tax=Danio rerio TaxID=7955 RepID=UPI00005486CB
MTFPVTSTASIGTGVTAGTTAVPPQTDMTVIGVVIALILLTLVVVGVLLYRYLCHSKGVYRTAGEPAPGVDPDQVYNDTVTENKKEYFI